MFHKYSVFSVIMVNSIAIISSIPYHTYIHIYTCIDLNYIIITNPYGINGVNVFEMSILRPILIEVLWQILKSLKVVL